MCVNSERWMRASVVHTYRATGMRNHRVPPQGEKVASMPPPGEHPGHTGQTHAHQALIAQEVAKEENGCGRQKQGRSGLPSVDTAVAQAAGERRGVPHEKCQAEGGEVSVEVAARPTNQEWRWPP